MKHTFGDPWTQIKLDLLGRYLSSFNQALQFSPLADRPFSRIYIDAFAGTGECEIKTDENAVETIAGSAKIALETTPAFDQVHLIDLNRAHVDQLIKLAEGHGDSLEKRRGLVGYTPVAALQRLLRPGLVPLRHNPSVNMASLFATGPMPWPKHSFPTSSVPLSQLIFQYTQRFQKVADHASVTGQH